MDIWKSKKKRIYKTISQSKIIYGEKAQEIKEKDRRSFQLLGWISEDVIGKYDYIFQRGQ